MSRARAKWLLLSLLLAPMGCVRPPKLEPGQAQVVYDAAQVLMTELGAHTDGSALDVPRSSWPNEFTAIGPRKVTLRADGLYIVTSSFFVEEAGVIVQREGSFTPILLNESEAALEDCGAGLTCYHIRG